MLILKLFLLYVDDMILSVSFSDALLPVSFWYGDKIIMDDDTHGIHMLKTFLS